MLQEPVPGRAMAQRTATGAPGATTQPSSDSPQAQQQRQEGGDSWSRCSNRSPSEQSAPAGCGTCLPKHLLEAVFFVNAVPDLPGIWPFVASVTFRVQEQIHVLGIRRRDVCKESAGSATETPEGNRHYPRLTQPPLCIPKGLTSRDLTPLQRYKIPATLSTFGAQNTEGRGGWKREETLHILQAY